MSCSIRSQARRWHISMGGGASPQNPPKSPLFVRVPLASIQIFSPLGAMAGPPWPPLNDGLVRSTRASFLEERDALLLPVGPSSSRARWTKWSGIGRRGRTISSCSTSSSKSSATLAPHNSSAPPLPTCSVSSEGTWVPLAARKPPRVETPKFEIVFEDCLLARVSFPSSTPGSGRSQLSSLRSTTVPRRWPNGAYCPMECSRAMSGALKTSSGFSNYGGKPIAEGGVGGTFLLVWRLGPATLMKRGFGGGGLTPWRFAGD